MTSDEPTDPTSDAQVLLFAELLEHNRPLPRQNFRGSLARQLSDRDPGWGPRPENLWTQALGLIIVGTMLLLIGALISAGGI